VSWRAIGLGLLTGVALMGTVRAQEDVIPQGDKSAGEEWQISQREKWFTESRGLSQVTRPDLLRAAAVREQEQTLARAPQQTLSWQSLGPEAMTMLSWVMGPVAGRVSAMAVDPGNENIIYLGTASGGLWKTTTGGSTWTQLFDQVGTQSIGSIYIEPGNPNNVWVGTGEQGRSCGGTTGGSHNYFGMGLFRSTDGGASFVPMNGSGVNKLNLSYVSAILVHPTSPNIVLAGGHGYCDAAGTYYAGALYRSTDGGANWTLSISGPVGDLLMDPTTPNTMYVGVGRWGYAGDGVYKTTNAGANWTRIETAPLPYGATTRRIRLAMAPSNAQVIYALINHAPAPTSDGLTHLYKSPDGGASWSQTNGGACEGQCSYNLCLAVHPTNPNAVLVGSIRHFSSPDSGTTPTWMTSGWGSSQTVHQDTHVLRYSTSNGNRYWAGTDGGLWRTDNGGTSFTNLNSNLHITQFYDVAVHPGNTMAVWGGAQDNSSSGRFGSQQWSTTIVTGDGFMNLVDPGNANVVFQTSYPSYAPNPVLPSVVRSSSGGGPSTFSSLAKNGLVPDEPYPWVTPLAIYDHDAPTPTYAFLASNYVYRAQADQATGSFAWTKISPNISGTTNSVNVITPVKNGTNVVIYAGTSTNGKIQRTANGLDPSPTWSDVTGNYPVGNVTDIAADPTNAMRVFATRGNFGDSKLWRSTTGGTSWSGVGTGLPNVPANSVAIDPADTNRVFVGTDIGVYQSVDGGTSFQPLMNGMPLGNVVTDLEVDNVPHALVAGSYGRGAWWLDLDLPSDLIFRDGFQ